MNKGTSLVCYLNFSGIFRQVLLSEIHFPLFLSLFLLLFLVVLVSLFDLLLVFISPGICCYVLNYGQHEYRR